MIVPKTVRDQLDQEAEAGITSLRYTVEIRLFNTHSPGVVGLTPDEAMLFATPLAYVLPQGRFQGITLRSLPGTWRAREGGETVSKGEVLSFLKSLPLALAGEEERQWTGRPVAF
jgi:hypothetical protein